MTKESQDAIIRAYATLKSLRSNIEQMAAYSIKETFVREFHSALDKLAGIGIDVSEFRIPDSEIAPTRTANSVIQPGAGHTNRGTYSKEKYVNKRYFLMKIDTVLNYFESITSEKPKRIGFRHDD